MIPPCINVRIACHDKKPLIYPYGLVVTRTGQQCELGKIIFARPIPCIITPTTDVKYVRLVSIKTKELTSNIMLVLDYGGNVDYLIYPKKVWYTIRDDYFDRLRLGDVPREPGMLLYGPPGTGKTSMLNLLGEALGLHIVPIRPDSILSKYIGESEKKLSNKFKEAEDYEPSLVLMDDAEWITRSRNLSGTGDESNVQLAMMNIILDRIESWGKKRRRILAGISTNASPTKVLESALLRSGRTGRPIFVPLPDYEAVLEMLKVLGLPKKVGSDKTAEYAKKFINLGANMKDIRRYAEDILMGKEPMIEDIEGRGYVRPMPHRLHADELVSKLKDIIPPFVLKSRRARLYFVLPPAVGEAVAVNYSLGVGKPPVLINDERFIDEALMTAEVSRSVLIISTDDMSEKGMVLANNISKTPIIFIGNKIPPVRHKRVIDYSQLKSKGKDLLLKVVLDYYNVKYDEKSFRDALRLHSDNFDRMLEEIPLWGYGVELSELVKHYVY